MACIYVVYIVPFFFDRTGYYQKINNLFFLLLGIMSAKLQSYNMHIENKKEYKDIYKKLKI